MDIDALKPIVESLIFASDIPIPASQIKALVEEARDSEIRKAVEALNLDYTQTNRAFSIVQVAGGFQMVTRENYAPWIRKLFQKRITARLSQAALEALAVIAFRQPVSKPEIEAIRGVNSDGVIHTLLERKLITMSGRAEGPGRPLLYRTTQEFLRYFGVNDLSDLPKPRELEELLKEESALAVAQAAVEENGHPDKPGSRAQAAVNAGTGMLPGENAGESEQDAGAG
ncbi:SMC-Scp complex subunit ScpB [bacterium]|nr:SMC-Scp complex subunit ScpB [bacterium]